MYGNYRDLGIRDNRPSVILSLTLLHIRPSAEELLFVLCTYNPDSPRFRCESLGGQEDFLADWRLPSRLHADLVFHQRTGNVRDKMDTSYRNPQGRPSLPEEQKRSYDKLASRPISCSRPATRGVIAYQLTHRSDKASHYFRSASS